MQALEQLLGGTDPLPVKGNEAKGETGVVTPRIAVPLRGLQADTPLPARATAAASARALANLTVEPAPVTISPTIYPQGPGGPVYVANSITINNHSAELGELKAMIGELVKELRGSNEASDEIRRQLQGELKAGLEIAQTPQPNKGALLKYLVQPLRFIAKEFSSGTIRALAAEALKKLIEVAKDLFS